MEKNITAVHVTHEAIGKIGGIGAVLEGLFTSPNYQNEVGRSILVSPLFSTEGDVHSRLGEDGEVLYSSIDGLTNNSYRNSFQHIQDKYNVGIVYGRRTFIDHRFGTKSNPEVLLFDISRMDDGPLNDFKGRLFSEFGIRSSDHEHLWEFEQYNRIALPAIDCLKAIGAAEAETSTVIFSHEFMGMATALAGILDEHDFKTVFYAHEVATMRAIVEKNSGHDTMFYNAMEKAKKSDKYVNDVFGDQNWNFKHMLVDASRFCDNILAVGDCVVDELKFMAPEFAMADIDLTYNGIPAYKLLEGFTYQMRVSKATGQCLHLHRST